MKYIFFDFHVVSMKSGFIETNIYKIPSLGLLFVETDIYRSQPQHVSHTLKHHHKP